MNIFNSQLNEFEIRRGGFRFSCFFISNLYFALFDFPIRFESEKEQQTNLHKHEVYNKNTIDVQTLGVRISMVFSYVSGD